VFTKNAKIETLKSVPLFAGCSRRELAEIAAVADEMHFASGRTLIRQGATGREFVVIVDGSVEVKKNGRRVPIAGDAMFFGEAALLTGAPRNATVTTTSPVRALVLTDRSFDRLLKDVPSIQRKVLVALAERLASPD
jgi:CRP/FNR family transcriptional regulator, cyclic AMP receptor protein